MAIGSLQRSSRRNEAIRIDPNLTTGVLIKRGDVNTETCTQGEGHVNTKAGTGVTHLHA